MIWESTPPKPCLGPFGTRLSTKPYTLNPKPKPQTLNPKPKPQTLNTLNPKLSTKP